MPETSRFCLHCGASLVADVVVTRTEAIGAQSGSASDTGGRTPPSQQHLSSSSSLDEGRFLPGTLLAGRYRIVALLGRGGMGEVYRANDLKLGQPVALKFLPESTATSETTLARFYNEIRIARQVSHPNVCRVYDLGDVEGQPYLSMEYVDGEDLGSLMRRIGRLPEDKALEIARKLCAGLAAAHDKGVLHRDLKPSNIMLDGRGNVLITDFGLAGIAHQIQGAEVRNGTPAYMAPEQLAGKEVSIKSDIYALGLVLYEVFTGKRAFEASTLAELVRMHTETTPVSPSSLVKDLDPAVERVLLRCLDPDPRNRPASALAVAAALPGGDPLAAALAAGETPSPQVVAAAGETTGVPLRIAVPCLAVVVVGLALIWILGALSSGVEQMQLEKPPDVLRQSARDIVARLGYTGTPADSMGDFDYDVDFLRHMETKEKPSPKWRDLLAGRPSLLYYWYRQSPRPLIPTDFHAQLLTPGIADPNDPAPTVSGMVNVQLDPQGRLRSFLAIPPEVDKTSAPTSPPDWKELFNAAGLDASAFQPAEPQWNSLAVFDARAAWTGKWPGTDRPLRIEAAAWRGKPVFFALVGPWSRPTRMQPFELTAGQKVNQMVLLGMVLVIIFGAIFFAVRNLKAGRGDRRGAFRLSSLVFFGLMALWLCKSHFIATTDTLGLFILACSTGLFVAGTVWGLYLAVEPFVRRHWPQAIISSTRLSGGQWRDPLVGRDVLFGIVLGIVWTLIYEVRHLLVQSMGSSPALLGTDYLMGGRKALGVLIAEIPNSIQATLIFFFLIFILRVLLRKQWLAAAVFTLIFASLKLAASNHPAVDVPAQLLIYGIAAVVVVRFGLIALAGGIFTANLLLNVPVTLNLSAWYAGAAALSVLAVLAVAVWSFHTSLAGRPLFKSELFE